MGRAAYDIDALLCGNRFSNPSHKAALKKRLFDENAVLSADDLAGVSGGVMTDTPKFEDWPEENGMRSTRIL